MKSIIYIIDGEIHDPTGFKYTLIDAALKVILDKITIQTAFAHRGGQEGLQFQLDAIAFKGQPQIQV